MANINAKVTIEGVEYTFQKLPVKAAFDLREQWLDSRGGIDQPKMYDLVLENIVISPKMKLEDFEEIWIVDELVSKAIEFQYGRGK